MLVGIRHPVGIGALALALLAFAAFLLSTVYGDAGGTRSGDRRVEAIRADSAPLIASDLAGFQERLRREGRGYAPDTEALIGAWLRQFDSEHRGQMREWTRYHGVDASATRTAFVIETSSAPGRDGWYRLTVDRRAGRIDARCGGSPTPGCRDGRWRVGRYGQVRRYLLGR
jgi:hypothetical protein